MVSCEGGSWQSEVSWSIIDADGNTLLSGGAPYSGSLCGFDASACYTVTMTDAYGDGWNGNVLMIGDASFSGPATDYAEGTLGTCTVFGCTDSSAANYNEFATDDDGSCISLCEACADSGGLFCGDDEANWTSYSPNGCVPDYYFNDGWEDCVDASDEAGDSVAATGYDCNGVCGGTAVVDECGVCDGAGIAEGACDCDGNVLDCNDVCGGDATVDECGECGGSGGLMVSCDGGSWQSEVSWSIIDADGNTLLSGGAPYSGSLCGFDASACYTVTMTDAYGDGWNGNVLMIGDASFSGPATDYAEGTLGTCTVFGCTDSSAANYNEFATDDDGSCISLCEACADSGGLFCGDDEANWTSYSPNGCVPDYYFNDGWEDCVDASDEAGDSVVATAIDCAGVCGGTAVADCAGECEGTAVVDECGECGGSGAAEGYDCDGNCLVDTDGDGVCDMFEMPGCQDSTACRL